MRALDQLQELIGGDKETLHELIATFLEEGTDIVADMQTALPDSDVDLLRRSAHSLKSSAQDFGAVKLSSLCAALESRCRTEWPDEAAEQVSMVAESFESARDSLSSYLSNNSSE